MRFLIIVALLLLPMTTSALDCTPFQSWTINQQGYYDSLKGVPGEIVCGVDYTGWTLHVIEVAVTQPGIYIFSGISESASMNIVDTAIILMDDCSSGSCISSKQSNGVTDLYTCLDVGTHSFVVASNTTAATAVMNIGIANPTCDADDAEDLDFDCVFCNPVGNDETNWGSLKARFQ